MVEIKKREERTPQTLDEQMMHRQSAPRPEAQDEAQKMMAAMGGTLPSPAPIAAQDGFGVLTARIGVEQIREANATLQKYKQGKANLEQRIIDNEQWYKLRHLMHVSSVLAKLAQ